MKRDAQHLITMVIKRIGKIHNKAKENLELTLEKQRAKTENIVEALQELLLSSYECTDDYKIAANLKNIVEKRGGYESLLNIEHWVNYTKYFGPISDTGVVFVYGFCGIFVAGRKLSDFYPITVGIGLSGYTDDAGTTYHSLIGIVTLAVILILTKR